MNNTSLALLTLSATILAACGGSSGNNATLSFAELADEGNRLVFENINETPTAISELPVTGVVTYNGFVAYGTGTTPEAILAEPTSLSQFRMNADFQNSTVDGVLYNFENPDDIPIDGTLQINNGLIAGNTFTASIEGSLVEGGIPVDYDGNLDGMFLGSDVSAISGSGTATASVQGEELLTVNGVFVGETD